MKPFKHKNSLLYKITGNGLKKPSYLLGTMHMVCAKDFLLQQKILKAMEKCSTYFMEVDLGSAQQIQLMQQPFPETVDIAEGLSISEQGDLDFILRNQFDLSLDEARQLPPVALVQRMTIDAIDCEDTVMVEMELLKIAQDKGLQTAGLETALEQLHIAQKVFNGKEILLQLRSAGVYKFLFTQMVKAYHSENLEELAMLITDKRFMSKRAYNILVINRNKRWTKAIPSLIGSENAFIAVGAGHLPGEHGILQLLGEKGYAVNPVYR